MHRFDEPRTIKGVTFRNRVLRSSVGGRMCAYNGMVTDIWKNFELLFARGGIGGIISTTFSVDPYRQSPLEYPTISDDRYVPPLAKRLEEIKQTGVRYIIQIGDPGSATQTSLFPDKQDSYSSSGGFDLLYGYTDARTEMTGEQIHKAIGHFAQGARRAKEAGADGIEITAEKGYLIHQFLNPAVNRRTDDWGVSAEGRFRLLREIVAAVRDQIGDDFLLGVRLSATDQTQLPYVASITRLPMTFTKAMRGNDVDQMIEYARALRGSVDYLHIAAGFGFINPLGSPGDFPIEEIKLFANSTRHLSRKAQVRATLLNLLPNPIARPLFNIGWGYKQGGGGLAHARRFKREVGLPVITNGGYQDLATIEGALGETSEGGADDCDFVSMARALIANQDLLDELRQGRTGPDNPCTWCNRCCARTATSPLGCYNVDRFGDDRRKMVEQIFRLNSPMELAEAPARKPHQGVAQRVSAAR